MAEHLLENQNICKYIKRSTFFGTETNQHNWIYDFHISAWVILASYFCENKTFIESDMYTYNLYNQRGRGNMMVTYGCVQQFIRAKRSSWKSFFNTTMSSIHVKCVHIVIGRGEVHFYRLISTVSKIFSSRCLLRGYN